MAITLVVEDGSIVPNANTYADIAYARQFAVNLGLVLPVDDDALAAALLAAMPYIESAPYQGQRADPTQALAWPRLYVEADGVAVPSDTVPDAILKAQCQAAYMHTIGIDLYPTIDSTQIVTREKVGPIETEYSDSHLLSYDGRTFYAAIEIYLRPYTNWRSGYRLSPAFGF